MIKTILPLDPPLKKGKIFAPLFSKEGLGEIVVVKLITYSNPTSTTLDTCQRSRFSLAGIL